MRRMSNITVLATTLFLFGMFSNATAAVLPPDLQGSERELCPTREPECLINEDAGTIHDNAYDQIAWAGNAAWGVAGDDAVGSYIDFADGSLGGGSPCSMYVGAPYRSAAYVYGYGSASCPGMMLSLKICVQMKVAGDWKKQGCAPGNVDGSAEIFVDCQLGTWTYRTKLIAEWCDCQLHSPESSSGGTQRGFSYNSRITC